MTKLTAQSRLFAVLGDPVARSLSPIMHNAWLQSAGIDAAYVALRVRDASAIHAVGALGFAGVNITAPHKEAAFAAAARHDPYAGRLQAANVLRVEPDGSLSAFNTDGGGFIDGLDRAIPDWLARFAGEVLVVGAGGAAGAVCLGLLEAGVQRLVLTNRTQDKANRLAEKLSHRIDVVPWEEWPRRDPRLVVNCVSDDAAIEWPAWRHQPLCIDLRYGAMASSFLAAARAAGRPYLDGLPMLIHQGARAFEHWFGVLPDIDAAYVLLNAKGSP